MAAFLLIAAIAFIIVVSTKESPRMATSFLLSDPFLQMPTENSVRVVWFTDFEGSNHRVIYGNNLELSAEATTTKLSRVREDKNSKVTPGYTQTTKRDIWRHEAEVTGLTPNRRVPYQAISVRDNGGKTEEVKSNIFSLVSTPKPGKPLKILLTSDHQLMPLTAANLQKVVETIGRVDAVFFAGDLVNIPDRASEWFDDSRGGAFFPCLQGRANYVLEKNGVKTIYHGGELIQHAPLFPAIGNHEVMGRFSMETPLNDQFDDSFPRTQAEKYYQTTNLEFDSQAKENWIKNNSFNTDTYEEIFSLPQNSSGGKKYYAVTFGDIRLVVLYVTNMWRSPSLAPKDRGRYKESEQDLNNPQKWGYGQMIFEPIAKGSNQYRWLEEELQSQEFKQAKYKIVMFHHPVHTLGGNIVPPYTDPIPRLEYASDGSLKSVRYDYPRKNDYIIRDLMPILEAAGVQFVYYGHSHLWNRFVSSSGMHFLESSNVGNTYGAHIGENRRPIPTDNPNLDYVAVGNPNGLEPVVPIIAPLLDENGQSLPYIASNDITVFSILDTSNGTVSSYYFDTRQPNSEVVKFDEFAIGLSVHR
ncbi:metallophosphoesterase [Hydrococcus rivularis NIES-593]|uniref:Metallophosphoesterase n=2 Tax=Hydrococcus TaxID=1616833 RepID=A0A1U7HBM6_9CYAN|nr:metallophosphoesterase [Hydrococcus rivularis NIES-593]